MADVRVTRHGNERVRKRCGIPNKAVSKAAQDAYDKGLKHTEATGKLYKYMTALINANTNNIRIYGDKVYIFADTTLVTVLNLPPDLKKLALKCMDRRIIYEKSS